MRYLLWGDTFTCFKFEDAKQEKKIIRKLIARRPEIAKAFTHPTKEVPQLLPEEECIHIFDNREEDPRCKKCGRKAFTHKTSDMPVLRLIAID